MSKLQSLINEYHSLCEEHNELIRIMQSSIVKKSRIEEQLSKIGWEIQTIKLNNKQNEVQSNL